VPQQEITLGPEGDHDWQLRLVTVSFSQGWLQTLMKRNKTEKSSHVDGLRSCM